MSFRGWVEMQTTKRFTSHFHHLILGSGSLVSGGKSVSGVPPGVDCRGRGQNLAKMEAQSLRVGARVNAAWRKKFVGTFLGYPSGRDPFHQPSAVSPAGPSLEKMLLKMSTSRVIYFGAVGLLLKTG